MVAIPAAKNLSPIRKREPEYFRTMGVPSSPVKPAAFARRITWYSCAGQPRVRRSLFPGENPLGQQVGMPPFPACHRNRRRGRRRARGGYAKDPRPTVYWCGIPPFYPDPEYLLKAHGDPMRLAGSFGSWCARSSRIRAVYDVRRCRFARDGSR